MASGRAPPTAGVGAYATIAAPGGTDTRQDRLGSHSVGLLWVAAPSAPHAWRTQNAVWRRCVEGQRMSAITTACLAWSCLQLTEHGKKALLLIWDHASGHRCQAVRTWIREPNHQVRWEQMGVRMVVCPLPIISPWLNPLQPHCVYGERGVVEADAILPAWELAERVCAYVQCVHEPHFAVPEHVA